MYTRKKGGAFTWANFHETRKCQKASCADRFYRVSHNSDNAVESADINSFIRLIKCGFHGAVFREIHSNPVTFCGHLLSNENFRQRGPSFI